MASTAKTKQTKSRTAQPKRKPTSSGGRVNGKKIALICLAVLLGASVIGGGVYLTWRLTDGFTDFPWTQEKPNDTGEETPPAGNLDPGVIADGYYIEFEGTKFGNGGVAYLENGSTYTVSEKFGSEYTVKFTAYGARDFSFTLGAEPYAWKNINGDDFTAGFTVNRTETGFSVSFGTLEEIIQTVKGNTATLAAGASPAVGEKFTMTVSSGSRSVAMNFITRVDGVDLDDSDIIFGDENEKPDEGEEPEPEETPLSEEAKAFISYVEEGLSISGDFQGVVTFLNNADEKYAALDADDQAQERVVKAKSALDILKSSYRQGITAEEWRAVQEEARAVFEG